MIKLVAIDLDNTLLNSNHAVSERNERAIKQAMEEDIQVVLATGKTRASAGDIIQRLGLTTPGIYLQGLAIYYPDGEIRHEKKLDTSVARKVITFAEDRGFDVALYNGSRILVRTDESPLRVLAEYGEPEPEAVGPLQNMLDEVSINKLIIIRRGEPRKIKALRWQLNMQLDGAGKITQAIRDMIEIVPSGTSKGGALKTLLRELGIAPENVLAIGDAENDIEMLELVGIGVAVGNASDPLKAVADHVVADNDSDGVAEALERFVLKAKLDAAEDSQADGDANESEARSETDTDNAEIAAEAPGPEDHATADTESTKPETKQAKGDES